VSSFGLNGDVGGLQEMKSVSLLITVINRARCFGRNWYALVKIPHYNGGGG